MEIYDKSLEEIHNDLIQNTITSDALVNHSLEKLKENEKYNAFNLVINDAKGSVTENILSGIPYALKDNISTKDIRTTACSNTLKDYVPVFDATCVKKLKDAGAVLIGKTNMDELAMGGTGLTGNTGYVHNPYDFDRITAGSSAGSAAAVALKIVPYALGTDTGDSIRKPAGYCNVVGYKPSYGLISRYGLFAFASSLDTIGVITNNVKDAATVVNEIKGFDEKDMTSIKDMDDVSLTYNINNDIKGKKLFYIKEIVDKSKYSSLDTQKIIDSFFERIEKIKSLGVEVNEVSMDENLLNALKPIYTSISCAEVTSNDSNLTGIHFGHREDSDDPMKSIKEFRTKNFSSLIKRRFVIGSFILQKENQEKYFINAKRARRIIVNKMNEFFEKYDGLILPASADIAPLIKDTTDEMGKDENVLNNHLVIGNFGGFPSITIPNGFVNNMPVGINITSKFKDDANMLNIANIIERENI